jgi:hypothetical protein
MLDAKVIEKSALSDIAQFTYFKAVHLMMTVTVYVIYLLTPWSRVLLEKLTSLQLVNKFPAFYGT